MTLDTELRTALVEEAAEWLKERFKYSALPMGPERFEFWEWTMEELGVADMEDGLWQRFRVLRSFLWSLLAGMILLLPWIGGFGFGGIFWMAILLGSCVLFPAAWAYNTRQVYELRDDAECGPDLVHHMALACYDSNILRGFLHWLVETTLLPFRTSLRHGVALRVRELFCERRKLEFDLDNFSPRWQRGYALATKLEEMLGADGLRVLLRYL